MDHGHSRVSSEVNPQSVKHSKNSSALPGDYSSPRNEESSHRAGGNTNRSSDSKHRSVLNTDSRRDLKSASSKDRRIHNSSIDLSKGTSNMDINELKKQSILLEKERQLIEIDRQLKQKERDISDLNRSLSKREHLQTGSFPSETGHRDGTGRSQYTKEDGGTVIRLQAALNSGHFRKEPEHDYNDHHDDIRGSGDLKIRGLTRDTEEDMHNTAPSHRDRHRDRDYEPRYQNILPPEITLPTQESNSNTNLLM